MRIPTTLVILLALASCMRRSDKYCANHEDPRCGDTPDALTTCTDNDGCAMTAGTPFCDVPNMTCVECRDGNDCRMSAPVCDADKTCRGCTAHAECPSAACLPDGSCGTSDNVAYVTEGAGGSAPCDEATPCGSIAEALTTGKPFIKIDGTIDEAVSIASGNVTLLAAPAARLRKDSGVILEIRGTATVAVYDLAIGDTTPNNVTGVSIPTGTTGSLELHRVHVEHCNAMTAAINIAAGTLTLERSILSENTGGGLSIGTGARFTVRNNFVIENGRGFSSGQSTIGGVLITSSDTVPNQFEYNTVANNGSNGTLYRGGMTCVGTMVSAIGNIFYGNAENGSTSDSTQRAGTCALGNSFSAGAVAGNLGFDLMTTPGDYHIGAGASQVLDVAGDCTASVRTDIDGQDRPFGLQCDLGADEYVPPQ